MGSGVLEAGLSGVSVQCSGVYSGVILWCSETERRHPHTGHTPVTGGYTRVSGGGWVTPPDTIR